MEKHYLIIDESGAKGYSRNPEQSDGELGVMTGLMIPGYTYARVKKLFESSAGDHNLPEKRHITDIPTEAQQASRDKIFNIFKMCGIPWLYDAIFTHGLYESEFLENRGGNNNERELLHAKLFINVMIKAFACLHKFRDQEIELIVISDQLDSGTIKTFKRELSPYLDFLHRKPINKDITSFNRETKKIIKSTHTSSLSPESNTPRFKKLDVSIICEDSAITFAADILANCTHFYIKKNYIERNITKLNSIQAIAGHPLEDLVMHTYDGDDPLAWQPSDVVYRRNKDKPT
ncbi:hypothetical protein HNE05_00370 [Aquipseudomonas campi]|uniref:DUF3800 domain-containing protein n=1 Tax=Aquipseudomonas campi TaxID=2731681 RepID=A0A6M8F0Q3_9GAMM|nr:hypothetical protein [Pseudomonas campi]QKE61884.1 hypothetical protein HNE05_00370 [Pseudomonas campi]